MELFWSNGLVIRDSNGGFSIDSSKAEIALVTHAHADHVPRKGTIFASEETAKLIEKNYSKTVFPIKNSIKFGDIRVKLFDSGHILGSKQLLIEDGCSLAYTSDFKLQDSLILRGAQPLDAEVLVIESTFGKPNYTFPERFEVYDAMAKWIKKQLSLNRFVILAGYSIGKAQELTAFVNEYLGIMPAVHPKIFRNNEIYKSFGVSLGEYLPIEDFRDSDVLILPPHLCSKELFSAISFMLKRKVASLKASGWPFKGPFDVVFPLSDHADFMQILNYIELSQPKIVYTMHGFAKELAYYLRKKLNINAFPIKDVQQKKIIAIQGG